MGNTKIEPGVRVGRLVVAEKGNGTKNRYALWRCNCDCGGQILLDTRCLQRGTVTSCGCAAQVKPGQKDLTGKRFGRLVCIAPTDQRGKSGGMVWKCRCDCGNECQAVSTQLIKGDKKSCGCLSHPQRKALIGKRFGRLLVTAYAGKTGGMHRWRCLCDCGRETTVGQTLLQSGKTKSCGCLRKTAYQDNLRLVDGTSVTVLEANKKRTISTNTSGYTGVYRNKKTGKWVAQITFKRKTYYLGAYEQLSDAVKARKQGEEMHDSFLAWYYQNQPHLKP